MKASRLVYGLLSVVFFLIALGLGYWIGATNAERNFLALSSMADSSQLRFHLAVRDLLVQSKYSEALAVMDKRIDTNISVLNSYADLSSIPDSTEFARLLTKFAEYRKHEGQPTGGIQLLVSKLQR